jgi:prolyl-tRNA synthetase
VVGVRRSDIFLPSSRESRGDGTETARLAERAGLVRGFGSGLYGFTPVGERVRRALVARVRQAMDAVGGQEVSLPALNYRPAWEESGRWAAFEGEMFTLENREGRDVCLAPSHEEGVVSLVDGQVRSYDDLPLLLYQVGVKYRDDHARHGLVRTKAFTMKDAYSLHTDEAGLAETYDRVRAAYTRFFDAVGVETAVVAADNSVMGGSRSEEFVAPVETGSVRLRYCTADGCRWGVTAESDGYDRWAAGDDCPDCCGRVAESDGVEVGHCFKLGTRYSEPADLTVDTADGGETTVQMGSYGVGVTRLVAVLLAQHADGDGCRWPMTDAGTVAPYRAAIVPLRYEGDLRAAADRLYDRLGRRDVLLFDDDSQGIGERFAESDLLGVPAKLVLGNDYRETGLVELETRDGDTRQVEPGDVPDAVSAVVGERVGFER